MSDDRNDCLAKRSNRVASFFTTLKVHHVHSERVFAHGMRISEIKPMLIQVRDPFAFIPLISRHTFIVPTINAGVNQSH
jgi:hypothetical protein